MLYLEAITRRPEGRDPEKFPWTLPIMAGLDELQFTQPVTFLAGENGSGKSTLLEGLAMAMHANAMGRHRDLDQDETLEAARRCAAGFRCVRRRHAPTRLFLRAEDVFGFVLRLRDEMYDLDEEEKELRASLPDDSWGQKIATGMIRGQRLELIRRYGDRPDDRSHGETFLDFLNLRIIPDGLYFLDEPETPLSPQRVLALIALIKDAVSEGAQFVIATHSPILMAMPQSEILLFEGDAIRPVAWDELEHVRLTRDFLNNPERYLKHL